MPHRHRRIWHVARNCYYINLILSTVVMLSLIDSNPKNSISNMCFRWSNKFKNSHTIILLQCRVGNDYVVAVLTAITDTYIYFCTCCYHFTQCYFYWYRSRPLFTLPNFLQLALFFACAAMMLFLSTWCEFLNFFIQFMAHYVNVQYFLH